MNTSDKVVVNAGRIYHRRSMHQEDGLSFSMIMEDRLVCFAEVVFIDGWKEGDTVQGDLYLILEQRRETGIHFNRMVVV